MTLQEIKKEFFALRNGVMASQLKTAGATPCPQVFGLNIPQISALARSVGPDPEMAATLWADRGVRESRLLALYIMGLLDAPAPAEALTLAADAQSPEEADVLAFKVLKRMENPAELLPEIEKLKPLGSYLSASLRRHLELPQC